MHTRPVKPSDLDALYALIGKIYESSPFMSQEFIERYPSRRHLERDVNTSLALVAENEGALLGYLFVTPNGASKLKHTSELNMGVAADARGRGVGGALIEDAFTRLKASAATEIVYLHVRSDNAGAVALYEKCGFERLCVLTRDTKIGADYFDGLLMRRFVIR